MAVHEFGELPVGGLLRVTALGLDQAGEAVAGAGSDGHGIAGQSAPAGLGVAAELFEEALHLILIHCFPPLCGLDRKSVV